MLGLLRLLAEVGAAANWIVFFIAAIIAVFMVYIGIAMWAIFRTRDADQQKIRYKVFRDLLGVFDRRRRP
jgi:hypothetical protein